MESCIPDGLYPLRRTIFYRKGYETFEVCNVTGRSRILIHKGNTEEDVMGCVAVGSAFGRLWIAKDEDSGAAGWKEGVIDSASAFKTFMYYMRGQSEYQLLVRWAEGVKPL